jgi:hypothetical protein
MKINLSNWKQMHSLMLLELPYSKRMKGEKEGQLVILLELSMRLNGTMIFGTENSLELSLD